MEKYLSNRLLENNEWYDKLVVDRIFHRYGRNNWLKYTISDKTIKERIAVQGWPLVIKSKRLADQSNIA